MSILDKFPDKALELAMEARRAGLSSKSFAVIEMPSTWLLRGKCVARGDRRGTYSVINFICEFDSFKMAQEWLTILGGVPDPVLIAELKARAKAREMPDAWIDIVVDRIEQQSQKIKEEKPKLPMLGKCIACGCAVPQYETECFDCRNRRQQREKYRAKRASGLCTKCGNPLDRKGHLCEICYQRKKQKERKK